MGNSPEKVNIKLSIITVNLNNREGLARTIKSVLSQTASFFEFIVIDGSSSDGSVDLIRENVNRISYWSSEPDKGIYQAMNKGIHVAKGEYVLFLNSGDFLVNNDVLDKVFQNINNEDLLYGKSNISRNGIVEFTTPQPDNLTLEFFFTQTISHQAAFIKKVLFEKHGYYREDLKIHADLDFWIRSVVLNNCSTKKINVIISDFNLDGISGSASNEKMAEDERTMVLRDNIAPGILADYESRNRDKKMHKAIYWAGTVTAVSALLSVLYQIALRVNNIKKKFRKARQ